MHQYYDYCDTYDSYDSGLSLNDKNSVKTFSCDECKQSKFILKKSTSDPKFKCEECIQQKEDSIPPTPISSFHPDVVLNLPVSSSFQASSAMLTMDGMYQPYQSYEPYQLQPQQEQQQQQTQQEQQQQQEPTLDTTHQFSWRWFNFFV